MKAHVGIIAIVLVAVLGACHHKEKQETKSMELTPMQQELLNVGWMQGIPPQDMTKEYGIKPVHGIQDNYFDIVMGEGCDVAVKIMDMSTHRCIRYVYVVENSETTVQEIPQGIYYLKLAYGSDWMQLETDSMKYGKFTRNVFYEKSKDTFDFGRKNSREEVNYRLEINVTDSKLENNFMSVPIDEEEFMK